MSTKKILTNLKFVFVMLFAVIVLIGGFIASTKSADASVNPQVITMTYSLSEVINTTNSDGSITTKIMVGCAPGSGDIYDINTGKLCNYYTPTKVLIGCAPESGDKYDINTGKLCTNYKPIILIGCAPKSGDIYDINTGKRCTNNTSIQSLSVTQTNSGPGLSVATTSTPDTTLPNNPKKEIIANELALVTTEPIETISKQEVVVDNNKDNFSASVGKIGSVFSGPMSFWIIILLIAILLGGGYGIYSFRNKNKKTPEMIKPIVHHEAPIVKTEVKQQEIPLNTVPPTTQANSHTPQSNIAK